jgi:S-disulfanyl-L-cysteine oxidoreductase SoxD
VRSAAKPRKHLGVSSSASLLILLGIVLARAHVGGTERVGPDDSASGGVKRSTVDGVFGEEQRRKGMQVYLKQCSTCHGERLRGGESAPALNGANFRDHWIGRTLDDFMQKINLMPPKDPGRLTPEETTSVMAVILAANGFPAGTEDLPASSTLLQQIRIEPPKTP